MTKDEIVSALFSLVSIELCEEKNSDYVCFHRCVLQKHTSKRVLLEMAGLSRKRAKEFEIHHILPLCLGGTSALGNLALAEPDVHKLVHRVISGSMARNNDTGLWEVSIPRLPKWATFSKQTLKGLGL